MNDVDYVVHPIPSIMLNTAVTSAVETEEVIETTTESTVVSAPSDGVSSVTATSILLAPFAIIIFLISVLLVIILKKG